MIRTLTYDTYTHAHTKILPFRCNPIRLSSEPYHTHTCRYLQKPTYTKPLCFPTSIIRHTWAHTQINKQLTVLSRHSIDHLVDISQLLLLLRELGIELLLVLANARALYVHTIHVHVTFLCAIHMFVTWPVDTIYKCTNAILLAEPQLNIVNTCSPFSRFFMPVRWLPFE